MSKHPALNVLWFKRDLRLHDNPALTRAAQKGACVLPLMIVEPSLWQAPTASRRQFDFMMGAVDDLDQQLATRKSGICLRQGEVLDVFCALLSELGHFRLLSHEEVGTQETFERDLIVRHWCKHKNIPWQELPQSGVVRRLKSRDHWQRRYDQFMSKPVLDIPKVNWFAPTRKDIVTWSGIRSDFKPAECQITGDHNSITHGSLDPVYRPDPSRAAALGLLQGFLTHGAQTYQRAMSSPLTAPQTCSRLAPYLAWGIVSAREIKASVELRSAPSKSHAAGYRSFASRLAWRDHFMQKLEDMPKLHWHEMHMGYANLRPRSGGEDRLEAWSNGQTGVPMMDAVMRALNATGWATFRMRAMLVSFACYHLWLDWRAVGHHLAQKFIDYEPGIHWAQVQMQAGVTGMNTPRIYNPVKQGLEHDPNGEFIRRWVPELSAVPQQQVHAPWQGSLLAPETAASYPSPIIDLEHAAKAARERIWDMRRRLKGVPETKEVIEKHASRRRPSARRAGPRKGKKQIPSASYQQLELNFGTKVDD